MSVAIDPSTEAAVAVVAVINVGSAYTLVTPATYSEDLIDAMETVQGLRVDVATEDAETLDEMLEIENRTSIDLRIWIRKQCQVGDQTTINALKLLTRQVYQQVNGFTYAGKSGGTLDSAERVKLWDCDLDLKKLPDKDLLQKQGMFVASIKLRLEVQPS